MIQEELYGVEIGPTLQQPATGFAPQIVHVQVHLGELLAAARSEPAVRSPVWSMGDRAKAERRPGLLIVLQALADFVAEHVRIGFELLAIWIVPPQFEHSPECARHAIVITCSTPS